MLVAVAFYEVVLALHIIAVVFAFGATFAYPVLLGAVAKADPRALPALYRALHAISQRVIMPGLAAIVVFGVYLASHLHLWHAFFVQWGIGVAIVIGAVEGAYLSPRERRLVEVADRDVAAAGGGGATAGDGGSATTGSGGATTDSGGAATGGSGTAAGGGGATTDPAGGGQAEVRFSAEHDSLVRQVGGVGALMDLLVLVTIYFMVAHT